MSSDSLKKADKSRARTVVRAFLIVLFPFYAANRNGMFPGRSGIAYVTELEFQVNGHILAENGIEAVMLYLRTYRELFIEIARVGGVLSGNDDVPHCC